MVKEPEPTGLINMDNKVFGLGLSNASVKPKSATVRVYGVSSLLAIILSAPDGGSFILLMLKLIVFGL